MAAMRVWSCAVLVLAIGCGSSKSLPPTASEQSIAPPKTRTAADLRSQQAAANAYQPQRQQTVETNQPEQPQPSPVAQYIEQIRQMLIVANSQSREEQAMDLMGKMNGMYGASEAANDWSLPREQDPRYWELLAKTKQVVKEACADLRRAYGPLSTMQPPASFARFHVMYADLLDLQLSNLEQFAQAPAGQELAVAQGPEEKARVRRLGEQVEIEWRAACLAEKIQPPFSVLSGR